jgi:hypothetical protein
VDSDDDVDENDSDDAYEDESDEAPRSRQQTNSAVVPFVALLQKDGAIWYPVLGSTRRNSPSELDKIDKTGVDTKTILDRIYLLSTTVVASTGPVAAFPPTTLACCPLSSAVVASTGQATASYLSSALLIAARCRRRSWHRSRSRYRWYYGALVQNLSPRVSDCVEVFN